MATRQQYAETAGMTLVFLLVVVALVVVQRQFGGESGTIIKPTFIALGLVPILFYLITTGRLEQLRGAGFEVMLRRQANRTLGDFGDVEIEVVREQVTPKETRDQLNESDEESHPTVLEFKIGREDFYGIQVIEDYLDEYSESLKYILFTDDECRFDAYMHFKEFKNLLNEIGCNLINEIENGDIRTQPMVNRAHIPRDSSIKAALQEMDRLQVNEVAVLNPNERFIGVVTQEELVRKLLAEAIQEV